MPGLKEVKNKIDGVSKTAQITKAMNMVASAKLRGAQLRMEAFRPYAAKFAGAMRKLSGGTGGGQPLMAVREEVRRVELIVITSDRGLCGSFNANVLAKAHKLIAQHEAAGQTVTLVTVGNKAARAFKRSGKIRRSFTDIMGTFQMFNAREIAEDAQQRFLDREVDQVELVYSRFKSLASQIPTEEILLPIKPAAQEATEANPVEYLFEPSPAEIMAHLLPMYLDVQVYQAMLEVGAGEQAARMTAMDNATTACGDMIKELRQLYNKARQAAITGDLMDIVGGAEALKG